jgi:ankyrin repeat protein
MALRFAAEADDTMVLRIILDEHPAKRDHIHTRDDEALRYAAERGNINAVAFLIERGANVHAREDWALRYAAKSGRTEVVKLLLKHGADVHAKDDWALRYATKKGHTEVTKMLNEHEHQNCSKDDFQNLKAEVAPAISNAVA